MFGDCSLSACFWVPLLLHPVSPLSVPWVILSLFFKGKAFACSTDRCTTSQSASRGTSARWRSCRCTGSTTTRSTPSTWPRSAFSSAPTAFIQTSWFWPPLSTRRKGAVVSRSLNVIVCGNSCQAFSADVSQWKKASNYISKTNLIINDENLVQIITFLWFSGTFVFCFAFNFEKLFATIFY